MRFEDAIFIKGGVKVAHTDVSVSEGAIADELTLLLMVLLRFTFVGAFVFRDDFLLIFVATSAGKDLWLLVCAPKALGVGCGKLSSLQEGEFLEDDGDEMRVVDLQDG